MIPDSEHLSIRESIRIKVRSHDTRRPTLELRMGQYRSSSGTWVELDRRIDRRADWYFEEVKDCATGSVLRSCSEPLSSHKGRGSARSKS
jgi:hypothetical protein